MGNCSVRATSKGLTRSKNYTSQEGRLELVLVDFRIMAADSTWVRRTGLLCFCCSVLNGAYNTVLVPMDPEPQPVTLFVLDDSHFYFGSLLVPVQCWTSAVVPSDLAKNHCIRFSESDTWPTWIFSLPALREQIWENGWCHCGYTLPIYIKDLSMSDHYGMVLIGASPTRVRVWI